MTALFGYSGIHMYRTCLFALMSVALSACSTYSSQPIVVQPFPGPEVSTSRAVSVPAAPAPAEGAVLNAPSSVPARPVPAQPARQLADGSRVPAVQGLLATAERERRAGSLEAASAALERAQRLAPQSSLIYLRLAEVRLQQQRPADAEQFARKGLGFASGPAAQAALWRVIAEARRQQGRQQSAQEAAARAAELEAAAAELL